MGFIRDLIDIVASLMFLAGLVSIGAGAALLTSNLVFHSGFVFISYLAIGVALIITGKGLSIVINGKTPLAEVGPVVSATVRNVCQYCGKATANLVTCDNCGGNPGLGGEKV